METSTSWLLKYHSLASISNDPIFPNSIFPINDRRAIRSLVPQLDGAMVGRTDYLNEFAGYVHHVHPIWKQKCAGVVTKLSRQFHASTTILALGSNTASFVSAIKAQSTALPWPIAHI